MKRFLSMLMVVVYLMTATSCAMLGQSVDYASNVINLKSDSMLIKKQYEKIYILVESKRDSFTEDEIAQLEDIHFAFSETANRIEEIMENPKKVVTPEELRQMYELAYIGYTNARVIVSTHKGEFTAYQWDQMEQFDNKLKEYDVDVRAILDNPDTDDINMTLGLIITLGGAAYKYILPVVVTLID